MSDQSEVYDARDPTAEEWAAILARRFSAAAALGDESRDALERLAVDYFRQAERAAARAMRERCRQEAVAGDVWQASLTSIVRDRDEWMQEVRERVALCIKQLELP